MDPSIPEFMTADVVVSTAGRDAGKMYYVLSYEEPYLTLVNGKDRTLDRPKRKKHKHVRKVLRSQTRVADKLRSADKVLNSELRRDLAYFGQELQSNNLGG